MLTRSLRREAMSAVISGSCMDALVCGRELSYCMEPRQWVLDGSGVSGDMGEKAVDGTLARELSGSGSG